MPPCLPLIGAHNAVGSIKAITAARTALHDDGQHPVSLGKAIATRLDATEVRAQFDRVVTALEAKLPAGPQQFGESALAQYEGRRPRPLPDPATPLLCFLAISREPVTIPQLMEWTHLEPGDIADVITEWREFLHEDPDRQPPQPLVQDAGLPAQ